MMVRMTRGNGEIQISEKQAVDRIGEDQLLAKQAVGEIADQALSPGEENDQEADHHAGKRQRKGQHRNQNGATGKRCRCRNIPAIVATISVTMVVAARQQHRC